MKKYFGICCLLLAAALIFSACGVDINATSSQSSGTDSLESIVSVDESSYEDSLSGLENYLRDSGALSGDGSETAAEMIGAKSGKKFVFSYNGNNNVAVELYEYDTGSLNDKAKDIMNAIESTKDESGMGTFKMLDYDVKAVISDSGKYIMIYTDSKADEVNTARKTAVVGLFKAFK